MEKVFAGKRKPKARSINFSQTSLAVDAAIAGQGVALVSNLCVADDIANGRLCRLFDHSISGEQSFFIVAPRNPRKSETVQRMRDWLIAQSKWQVSRD
jgi:LysR family glycine cleavage system transcriptional activator